MPKIYRAMKMEGGKPVIDASGRGLGVRGVPVNGIVDVHLDAEGRVSRDGQGMSVAPAWRDLPYFLVPRRLRSLHPKAQGPPSLSCFSMGEGPFEDGAITHSLDLKRDKPTHGNVVPSRAMTLDDFQAELARTRDDWTIDEA